MARTEDGRTTADARSETIAAAALRVFALLADGTLTAQVAARMPLTGVAAAMRLVKSGTVTGKVVLIP